MPSRTCRLDVIAFLWVLAQYEAKGRISAEAALRHAYFKSLGERVHLLPDSKCRLSSRLGDVEQRASAQPEGDGLQPDLFGMPPVFAYSEEMGASAPGWSGSLGAANARNGFGQDSVE